MNQKKQTLFWVAFAVLVVLVAGGIVCYAVFANPTAATETASTSAASAATETTASAGSSTASSAVTSNTTYKLEQFLEGTLSYSAALGDPDVDPEENPAYDGAYDYTYGDLILTVEADTGMVISLDLICSDTPIDGVPLKNFSLWGITATDTYLSVKNTLGDPDDELDDSENLIIGYSYQSWYIKLYFDPDTRKLSEISCFAGEGV